MASRPRRSFNSPDANELYRVWVSTISDILAPCYGVHTSCTGRMFSLDKNNFQSTHRATRIRRKRMGLVLLPRRQLRFPLGAFGSAFEIARLRDASLGTQPVEINGNVRDAKPQGAQRECLAYVRRP
jgi:hypothetical protein